METLPNDIETYRGVQVRALDIGPGGCLQCHFNQTGESCRNIPCTRDLRPDKRDVYLIKVKESEIMNPTPVPPVMPQAIPAPVTPAPPKPTVSTKRLADDLKTLTEAEKTLAQLHELYERHQVAPADTLGLNLQSIHDNGRIILRNRPKGTTLEVETTLLRQALEIHQDALLQTLLDLHAQQVAEMKTALSEQLLDMAVEYRK